MKVSKISMFYYSVIVLAALFVLDRVWFGFVPAEIFIKAMVTLGVVGGAVFAIDLIKKEIASEKELKKDKYID